MGRKSAYNVGDLFGKLMILEIIPSNKSGKHSKLRCLCGYCNKEKIMNAATIKRRVSCGCKQHTSAEWKFIGPKTKPWQLLEGQAARNNVEFSYKRSARARGLVYDLTTEEFNKLILGICVYCGDSLSTTKKGQGKTSGNFKYTGIDRIDSEKGYTIDNCVSCCSRCNFMKHKMDKNTFIEHVKKIANFFKGF